MKILAILTATLLSSAIQAAPSIPWRAVVKCEGPSGSAVLDGFHFYTHGHTIYLNQFVIRSREINEYLASRNLLATDVSTNYPLETIIPVARDTVDLGELPPVLSVERDNLIYKLEIKLPEVKLGVFSKLSRSEIGNWIFRECNSTL